MLEVEIVGRPPADLPMSAGLSVEVEVDTGHQRRLFGPDTPASSPGAPKAQAGTP